VVLKHNKLRPLLRIAASCGFLELTRNVIRSSHGHSTPSLTISCKSVQRFARNVANKEISIAPLLGFSELTQNWIRSFHGHSAPSLKISWESVQPFNHNLAKKETKIHINKEIDRKQYPIPRSIGDGITMFVALPVCGWPTFPSVLWCCWLGLSLTCKTVSRITYTVLVETLNPAQSNPIRSKSKNKTGRLLFRTTLYICLIAWNVQVVSTANEYGKLLSVMAYQRLDYALC